MVPVLDAPPREAQPLLPLGAIVWLASELMFFAGLFAAYYALSARNSPWPPEGVELETARAAASTVVLLGSSLTMYRAEAAAEAGDHRASRFWLALTIFLGAVFVVNLGLEWAGLDFEISTNAYGSIYYLLTGFHGLHLVGGLLLLTAIGFIPAATGERQLVRLRVAGYYWHFVDAVWILVFLTIFVVR
jgi:cytochrome c oxidase subunit III